MSRLLRPLAVATMISGGVALGMATPAFATSQSPVTLAADYQDDDRDDRDDRDDGGAPSGGVETGGGGTAGADLLLPLGLSGAAAAGGVTFFALRRRRDHADS